MVAQGRKLVLLSLLLAVVQRAAGQDLLIGNLRPCEVDPAADPDSNNPTDNLSCPRLDDALQCYSQGQLCNGTEDCMGGSDEGENLVALDCGKNVPYIFVFLIFTYYYNILRADVRAFFCSPGEPVPLTALCDGNQDCTGGDDETTTLCESE